MDTITYSMEVNLIMKNIMDLYPEVSQSFFDLTKTVTKSSTISSKNKELILIGIFTANRGEKGLHTHVNRALNQGVPISDIFSTILLTLPVIGITNVTLAFDCVVNIIKEKNCENN
ncbi:hypothetical protein AKUH3B209X_PPKS00180 (plasmid) [Apilactobacillus kunkeei]|nr:hypothetical protein AKUH4B403J_PPKS00180 [Apilactobacillus kunkeei]CAI2673177.1 hypothetical protein AKUH4B103J_PPKS00180 [Apilactobacillus kunkeei]CAI2673790.1 hypothetical protein AKUH4B203M_PPKS00180 [Apilactobacillus kunkeei]CAI2675449.1 hypothetical protein AKUH4B116J_PPKS00180 [Apilactobacillus kunkeei]CAI2675613.1 hypothetical protein AKUH4B303J_PPKS00180 [Apilactobacillus kunkeei]